MVSRHYNLPSKFAKVALLMGLSFGSLPAKALLPRCTNTWLLFVDCANNPNCSETSNLLMRHARCIHRHEVRNRVTRRTQTSRACRTERQQWMACQYGSSSNCVNPSDPAGSQRTMRSTYLTCEQNAPPVPTLRNFFSEATPKVLLACSREFGAYAQALGTVSNISRTSSPLLECISRYNTSLINRARSNKTCRSLISEYDRCTGTCAWYEGPYLARRIIDTCT